VWVHNAEAAPDRVAEPVDNPWTTPVRVGTHCGQLARPGG
jgi:hypothetical protein